MDILFKDDPPTLDWFRKPDPFSANDLEIIKDLIQTWTPLGKEYTVDDINNLRSQARTGYLRTYESFYDEMERFGISTQVQKIKEAARGANIKFGTMPAEAALDRSGDPEMEIARVARDYVESQLEEVLPDTLADSMNLFLRGYEGIAPHFEARGARVGSKALGYTYADGLSSLEEIPHRRFRLNPVSQRMEVYPNIYTGETFDVRDLGRYGLILYDEIDTSRPLDQRGLLWQCINPWTAFTIIFRLMAKYVATYGMPLFSATYDPKSKGAKDEAIRIVNTLAASMRVAVPNNLELKFDGGARSGAASHGTIYSEALEFCIRLFDQILLGHSHSSGTQVGTGSKTSSDKAAQDFMRIMHSRVGRVGRFMRRQLAHQMVARAFGPEVAALHTPTIEISIVQDLDYKSQSEMYLNMFDAGIEFDHAEARSKLGCSEPDPAVLAQQPQPVTAPPPDQARAARAATRAAISAAMREAA